MQLLQCLKARSTFLFFNILSRLWFPFTRLLGFCERKRDFVGLLMSVNGFNVRKIEGIVVYSEKKRKRNKCEVVDWAKPHRE